MNILKLIYSREIPVYQKLSFVKQRVRAALTTILASEKKATDNPIIEYIYQGLKFCYSKYGVRAQLLASPDYIYDETVTNVITNKLAEFDPPLFLDIGAHAGFMSVNILANIPHVRIYAFEPGQFQASLFRQTIAANNLESRVTLYNHALGAKSGEADFCCQETPDADWSMSNGFYDTGRGKGLQKTVSVEVKTLDDWWIEESQPPISVVKMDTEGAELLILKSGSKFLRTALPVIYLEINPLNLSSYPYNSRDILQWFNDQDYELRTIKGEIIEKNNLIEALTTNETFVASPRH